MEFKEICIEDKKLFDSYLKSYKPQVSELTFSNLYMWRNYYKLRYREINGFLCIISVPDNGVPFSFMPLGETKKDELKSVVDKLGEYFKQNGWQLCFKRLTEAEVIVITEVCPDKTETLPDRDNSDYLYICENLIKLSGKKYDGKRNHINRFKKEHEFEYVPITEELIGECRRITSDWCKERDCEEHRKYYCEKIANFEMLDNFTALGCKGALLKVDGIYKAFTIGEMLNDDTAVIHIEKADSTVNGLYPLINQQFCQYEWANASFINREQDLGVEGLRKAKLSYNPVKLIEKYTVTVS